MAQKLLRKPSRAGGVAGLLTVSSDFAIPTLSETLNNWNFGSRETSS